MSEILLYVFENPTRFEICLFLFENLNGIVIGLKENSSDNNFENFEIFFDYKEIILSLSKWIYNSEYHYKNNLRDSDKWFIDRFNEINIVFSTLKNYNTQEMLSENDRILMINSLNELCNSITELRRFLLIKHFDTLLVKEYLLLPSDVNLSILEIPIFGDINSQNDSIHQWRIQTINNIHNNLIGYEDIGLRLIEKVENISYNILTLDQIDFLQIL